MTDSWVYKRQNVSLLLAWFLKVSLNISVSKNFLLMENTLTGQNSLTVPRHVVEVKKVAGAAVPIPLHKTAERIALAWERIRSMLTVM